MCVCADTGRVLSAGFVADERDRAVASVPGFSGLYCSQAGTYSLCLYPHHREVTVAP